MVGTLLIILINGLILFLFFVFFRRRIDSALQSENILRDIRSEVERMIIDLNQTTDRNIGIVEEQLERLSARIAEADRRIGVLKKEAHKERASEAVYTQLRPIVPPAAKEVKPAEKKPDKRQEGPPEEKKTTRERVLELYRSGLEAREIAAQVDKTLGEVELIIALGTNRG